MKKWFIILLVAVFPRLGKAQVDPIFSQIHFSPVSLNPAATGVFYGGYRLMSNYKTQWATVGTPYTTYQASFDMPIIDNIWVNDFVAIGVNVISDDAGTSNFLNNGAMLSVSYGKALDPREENFITVGFSGGAYQRSVTVDGLNWESQFNRVGFDPSLPSGESFVTNGGGGAQALHPDFGLGIHYVYNNESTLLFKGGASMHHITRPTYQFFGAVNQVYRRLNIHAELKAKPSGSTLSFWPRMLWSAQGPNRYLYVGSDFHWLLQEAGNITGSVKEITLALGPYYRHRDGMGFQTRLRVGGLMFGASYDFNLSQLRVATNNLGGPEILLVYQAGYKKGRKENHDHKRFEWRYD